MFSSMALWPGFSGLPIRPQSDRTVPLESSRGLGRLILQGWLFEVVLRHLVAHSMAADSFQAGGLGLVTIGFLQGAPKKLAFVLRKLSAGSVSLRGIDSHCSAFV